VGIDADSAARALADGWENLLRSTPGWWAERHHGAVAGVTGVGLPTLNGVWVYEAEPDPEAVAALLGRIQRTGLPHCLEVRPEAVDRLANLAASRGMSPDEDLPLMVLEGAEVSATDDPPLLRIRELDPGDHREHAITAAAGFEADEEHFFGLITAELARRPGIRCYIGEVEGEPVTTGLGLTYEDWVGVFNIATPPAHRRRGYGAAMTMRVVHDGLQAGADWAWLQSSPAGLPVYERLGFTTLARWRCWIAAA
jgi:GNAT superfamily N-acetyltransferase